MGEHLKIFSLPALQLGAEADEFWECLTTHGLFYIIDHGLTEGAHLLARKGVMNFFENASEKEKQLILNIDPNKRRGYSALESESTAQVTNNGNYSDFSMAFSMGLSENLFPTPKFEKVWKKYFNSLFVIAKQLANVILKILEFYCKIESSQMSSYDPVLRFRYFPDVSLNIAVQSISHFVRWSRIMIYQS